MDNDDVYAAGLLNRALDPATQPFEIQAFLRAELELLQDLVHDGIRILDVGCGTGRHLLQHESPLGLGVGVDYERSYIMEAARRVTDVNLHFVVADATAVPLKTEFHLAICLTNTWGTMSDKAGVLREMRRLAPRSKTRLISVYSETSVAARREWYRRLGHAVLDETDEYLVTDGGFRSEHFSEARLRALIGECNIQVLGDIGRAVRF